MYESADIQQYLTDNARKTTIKENPFVYQWLSNDDRETSLCDLIIFPGNDLYWIEFIAKDGIRYESLEP